MSYAKLTSLSKSATTPQTQKIVGSNQEKNNAGGYSFVASIWDQLDRFLILGSNSGSYYVSANKMSADNAEILLKLLVTDGVRVVERIAEVSDKGLAVKNAPAVFALAVAVKNGNPEVKKAALANLAKVCRTSTDFFSFVDQYKQMGGGFGSSVRKALTKWYKDKDADQLAYQLVKYRQRDGWSHHDVLHLCHAKADSEVQNNLFKFAKLNTSIEAAELPAIVHGYLKATTASSVKEVVKLVEDYNLPREALPTQFLNSPEVWDAMLPKMPATALLRNLGTMASNGLLSKLSASEKLVASKLTNREWLAKSRIHPISILIASKIYGSGRGLKGSNVWTPSARIMDSLQDAFYNSFDNIEPTNENYLLGVDISGSMMGSQVAGIPNFSAAEASVALAMAINKQNQNSVIMGFSHKFVELDITYKSRIEDAIRKAQRLGFGATDCALPMVYATQNKLDVDKFVVITDSETYFGANGHPSQALQHYRNAARKNSGLIVCATTATQFTIADPKDPKQLDVVGFSPDVPRIIASL
jgi:60 kDa SS-A/Ro ribonucleoprotein